MSQKIITQFEPQTTYVYSPGKPLEDFDRSLIPNSLKYRSEDGVYFAWEPQVVVPVKELEARYCRNPYLTVLPDGVWMCNYVTGGETEPRPENYTGAVKSIDGGKTWSSPFTLFRNALRGSGMTHSGVEASNRTGVIVHTVTEGFYMLEARPFISWYNTESKRWSVPELLPGVPGGKIFPGFRAKNGTYVLPYYWAEGCENMTISDLSQKRYKWQTEWEGGLEETVPFEYRHACGVVVSEDNGKTFSVRGHVGREGLNVWEPTIVELESGHWIMIMRAEKTGYQYRSESFDFGQTWSAPRQTDIPDPSTKSFLMKVGEAVLLFHNPNLGVGYHKRKQVELWVSKDGMQTWEQKIPIANAHGSDLVICYPHGVYLPETHEIALVLDTARTVYMQRIPCAEIGI